MKNVPTLRTASGCDWNAFGCMADPSGIGAAGVGAAGVGAIIGLPHFGHAGAASET